MEFHIPAIYELDKYMQRQELTDAGFVYYELRKGDITRFWDDPYNADIAAYTLALVDQISDRLGIARAEKYAAFRASARYAAAVAFLEKK
ncbi:MAG: hypothetical protein IJC17_04745 [Clostridia bacterium]|nr:hypothetical protein [Clostridia bacterium]